MKKTSDNYEKILKKLASYKKDSRNFQKYSKILRKHLKRDTHLFLKKAQNVKVDPDKVKKLLDEEDK